MKKLLVLLLGVFLCVSFAQSYTLSSVSNSWVQLNRTAYDCSKTSDALDLPQDLGNIGTLVLDATCSITETQASALVPLMKTATTSAVYLVYSFDKSNWTDISLIGSETYLVGPSSRSKSYSRSNQNIDLSAFANGESGTLYLYFWAIDGGTIKTDPTDTTGSNYYTATFTKIADIDFTDGSGFIASPVARGNVSQVIGRFWLSADVSGATLTDVSVDLNGTRTGFSNFKLWSSADDSFTAGVDVQLGSKIAADPGAGPAVFSSFSSGISTEGTYYFITADVDAEATGSIQSIIAESSDLTVSDGEVGEVISNALLSTAEIPTSICLASFTVALNNGKVELAWSTASETENDHFNIYRDGDVIAEIAGHGTCTEPHTYTYTDAAVEAGQVYEYKLSDLTWGGIETEHAPVMIEIREEIELSDFVLRNAYPNPFNPRTVIRLQYAVGSNTVVNIYNTQGVLVDQLMNGFVEAGSHNLTWDASDMPSGVYLVTMQAGNTVQSQKIVLMK